MKLRCSDGFRTEIICAPSEADNLSRGDYLLVEEEGVSQLVQVLGSRHLMLQQLDQHLVRELLLEQKAKKEDLSDLSTILDDIKDTRILETFVRGVVYGSVTIRNSTWIPSRTKAKVRRLNMGELSQLIGLDPKYPVPIGRYDGDVLRVDASAFDSSLTLILGRKGQGKSHLAKLLICNLVKYGFKFFVFDLNGEYTKLGFKKDGSPSELHDRIIVLSPGKNFKLSLEGLGLRTLVLLLRMPHLFNTREVSIRAFEVIWKDLASQGRVTLSALEHEIYSRLKKGTLHREIAEALLRRVRTLRDTGLFDENAPPFNVEDLVKHVDRGGAIVLNLSELSQNARKVVVEIFLSELERLLARRDIGPIAIVAEEAQFYTRETYWENLVTRMRHLGISIFLITNQPKTVPPEMHAQADNCFIFNFRNQSDLNEISKLQAIDRETLLRIVPFLDKGECLVIGKVTKEFPLTLRVLNTDIMVMGETRTHL